MHETLPLPLQEDDYTTIAADHQIGLAYHLRDPDGLESHKTSLEECMAGEDDPSVGRAGKLIERADSASTHIERTRLHQLAEDTYGRDKKITYIHARNAMSNAESTGLEQLYGARGRAVLDKLLEESSNGVEEQTADLVEKDLSREAMLERLDAHAFVTDGYLSSHVDGSARSMQVVLDEDIHIPTAIVVGVSSMESWRGRDDGHGPGTGNKEYTDANGNSRICKSLDAIIDYAQRGTELPGVEDGYLYIQPDGKIFFVSTISNHRTAAAVARGDEKLKISGVINIRVLKENVL